MRLQGDEYSDSSEFESVEHLGAPIERFKGEGQLELPDGGMVPCKFDCALLDDGRILTGCHLSFAAGLQITELLMDERSRIGWRLEGRTLEGLDLFVEKALVKHYELAWARDRHLPSKVLLVCNEANLSSPETADVAPARLTYGLANLEFVGDEATEIEIEGERRWSRDTFRFQVDSTEIRVRQVIQYRQVVKQMKDRRSLAITAEAHLQLAGDEVELRSYDGMIDAICVLFSLANGSKVRWLYSKKLNQEGQLISMRVLWRETPFWVSGGPLIGGTTAKELKEFVAHSYGPYLDEQERFNLPVAIDYYLASKSAIEWNTRFLLACIALETLVGNFAQHTSRGDISYMVPPKDFEQKETRLKVLLRGTLREVFPGLNDEQVDGALAKVRELNRRSVRRVIKHMLVELGIEHTDLSFIDLRHRVIHTGVLGRSFRETFDRYTNLIELLDKIFLRILDYGGDHLQYSQQVRAIVQ